MGWFRAVKAWIAVSDFMREKFISAGVPADDIFTLRHFWHPIDEISAPRDEGYYVFMGRLVEMKGIKVLLETWDQLLRDRGDRAPKLVIAGDGELAPFVISKAKENSLITYRGHVSGEEKSELLRDCSAVIAPSLCLESLGLVTYEAYDYSKPMLVARAGGLAETVTHGITGLIHEPGDAAGLAEHVLEVASDGQRRVEMGRNGREWLIANTGFEAWQRGFSKVFEHALANRGAGG
jgi:glycosyltransferase involved in cell wall biosynthesis